MRRAVAVLAGSAVTVACGLGVLGSSAEDEGTPNPTTRDASKPSLPEDVVLVPQEASSTVIETPDGTVCTIRVPDKNAPLPINAFHATDAVTIDGKSDEWPCTHFVQLNANNAGAIRNSTTASAAFAVGWGVEGLYFVVRVTDLVDVGGTDQANPYQNDAFEIYFGSDPTDGSFQSTDMHVIVDYKGLVGAYNPPGRINPLPVGIDVRVLPAPNGYIAEGFISKNLLGIQTMSTATKLKFNVQIDDNRANAPQAGVLWLFQNQGPNCGNCNCPNQFESACSTWMWGQLTLDP